MSSVAKILFGLLVAAMIVSVILGYHGIAKLRQDHYPPFLPPAMMLESSEKMNHPSQAMIRFLDSNAGKILVGYLVVAVPVVCGVLIGKRKWQLWSLAVLTGCAALFCWMGIRIYLHSVFDAFDIRNAYPTHLGDTAPLRAILSKLNDKVPGLSAAIFPATQPYGDNATVAEYTSDKYELTIIAKTYDSAKAAREGQESDSRKISVAADRTDMVQGVRVHEYTRYGGLYFQTGICTFRIQTNDGADALPFLLKVSSALMGEAKQANVQKESPP